MSDGLVGASGIHKVNLLNQQPRSADVVPPSHEGHASRPWQKLNQPSGYKGIQPDFDVVLQEVLVADEPVAKSVNKSTQATMQAVDHALKSLTQLVVDPVVPLASGHYRVKMAKNAYNAMRHAG